MSRLVTCLVTLALLAACQKTATAQKSGAGADQSAPVARWNGGAITAAELDAAVYEQRKQALDQMLVRKLVEQKAAAEKITPEELFKREVVDKLKKPSDEEMKKFYDEQAKLSPGRLPPFEQIKDQIAMYMERPQLATAQQAFIEALKKELNVQVTIRPPRMEVAAEGPSKGPPGAPVTIVEFSDFECPYCSTAEQTVQRVMKEYEGKVRLVYRDFPLPIHANAVKAAEAAQCAGDQGKYWDMHEKLFANQQALELTALKGYAKDLNLDQAKFDQCLDSGTKSKVIEESKKVAEKVGVNGTPAFFINGYKLNGAQPFEEFKTIIDAELSQLASK
jgi:protein-disulfide isomerase